ncbi:hypothetical protein [Photobacterium swingsii]|nr:hypothetical protein [Photobacterium swingsii]
MTSYLTKPPAGGFVLSLAREREFTLVVFAEFGSIAALNGSR